MIQSPRLPGIFSVGLKLWLILLMVQLSNMLFGMTITIANVVLPQIKGTMSVSQDEASWSITLNLVAAAVATPLTGWLAGRLGWRFLMFGTVLGFTLCSLLCGLAPNLESLIIFRVGQGIFGAPIMPLGQAIILSTFPRHLQPTAIVLWGVGAVFGPVIGPVIGSMMAEAYNWRAAFFVLVPVGIGTLFCTWFALADYDRSERDRFDWLGFITLSAAIIALQLIFDRGHRLDWYDSNIIVGLTFIGCISFWIFIIHCCFANQPFINLRIFLDRNFSLGTVISFVMGTLAFTGLVLFPSLLHDLRGYPDSIIGLLVGSRGLGNWLAFLVIIPLTRLAPRLSVASGLLIQAFASYMMARFDLNVTNFDIVWTNMLLGFGQSIAFTPMAILAFATLPKLRVTEGTTIFTLMRNFGSSIFISLSVLVLLRSTSENYSNMSENISMFYESNVLPVLPVQWQLGQNLGLLQLSLEIEKQASMIGYINSFHLMAIVAILATPLAVLMRPVPK
ncbi:MAG: MFS transporter [Rhodospirillaceae bacterium]|mgnify:CR=1 FL=1|nr:MFS transporter [Rhodospirillaceae bacterium]